MPSLSWNLPVSTDWEAMDADLLTRARQGDAEAFCALCRDHEERLLRQSMLLCGEPAQAEVLARETLVEAWRSLGRYGGRSQFFTWLCAILLRRHHNARRSRRLWTRYFISPTCDAHAGDSVAQVADYAPCPAESLQQSERWNEVRRCLDRLPPKQREVIYLRYFVDRSLEGIAAALGCSVGTVKSRLHHGLEKLRGMRELDVDAPRSANPTP